MLPTVCSSDLYGLFLLFYFGCPSHHVGCILGYDRWTTKPPHGILQMAVGPLWEVAFSFLTPECSFTGHLYVGTPHHFGKF